MIIGFADPPYPGEAHRYPEQREVDHPALIAQLVRDYPDGWALSTKSPSLRALLAACPPTVRVLAWVKPFCSFKPGVGVAYAWEPVLLCGGRRRTREQATVRDWVPANITLRKGLVGAKPDPFWFWLFAVFNLQPGDTFVDLFPGTGGGGRAFEAWIARDLWRQSGLFAPEDAA